jgi:quercetin dioxygenase-like cupin family protein
VSTSISNRPVPHRVDTRWLETVNVLGPTIQFLTGPRDGEPCVMRGTIPSGVVVPLHSHPDPETFVILHGEVQALERSRGGSRWVPLVAGDVFHVPGDAKHAWCNTSQQPAVMLVVTTARLGRFLREVGTTPAGNGVTGAPSQEAIERFLAIAHRYGYWNATPEENDEVGIRLTP